MPPSYHDLELVHFPLRQAAMLCKGRDRRTANSGLGVGTVSSTWCPPALRPRDCRADTQQTPSGSELNEQTHLPTHLCIT